MLCSAVRLGKCPSTANCTKHRQSDSEYQLLSASCMRCTGWINLLNMVLEYEDKAEAEQLDRMQLVGFATDS